ncbi:carbohydrate ABC transporter permease [Agrobacterium rhizogenes]|uniref:Carbohydrate ABC transporter permease n=2 Tax=unclassified Rhizobium TaxID=2613769 RepID=A0AAU7SKG8_9HYPH|nr:carbohydrate ABC transporter permease [Rhizobium rhizogenes]NTJ80094.1 carbohydrate ABC transporter permease [Rhizobium rhizogenes]
MLKPLRWIVYAIVVSAMNFPILVTLITSFKTTREISSNPGLWIEQPTFDNYLKVLTDTERFNIFLYLANSVAAALIGTLLAILLTFPAAYVIARSETGQKLLLPLVINLRAVPLVVFAIPLYMMYQWLGLLDTRIGLGLILTIVNIPLALVMLVNAISDIPVELDEAATVDGASVFQIMIRIIRPVIRPALVTTFIFGFITAWNEFLFGLMLTTNHAVPMTVGASFFFAASGGGVQWGLASAVMILGALPPALLGLVMYRQLSGSMTAGAVKG